MTEWSYQMFVFFLAHLIAMSSTLYNPFVYAWFNDTFRAQFLKVLPCCSRWRGRAAAGRRRCGDLDASPSRFATGGFWSSTTETNQADDAYVSLSRERQLQTTTEAPPPPIELKDLGATSNDANDR